MDFMPTIIKQERRKIYRFLGNQFHLLYDFDVEVGEILSIVIDDLGRPQDSAKYLKVIVKELVGIDKKEVQVLKLESLTIVNCPYSWTFEGWHYEGIGSAIYVNAYNPSVCDYFV